MDPLRLIGVIHVVLLIAIAGHTSFGILGLVTGLLVGISVTFGLLQLLHTRNSRAVDPLPRRSMVSDWRHQADIKAEHDEG